MGMQLGDIGTVFCYSRLGLQRSGCNRTPVKANLEFVPVLFRDSPSSFFATPCVLESWLGQRH